MASKGSYGWGAGKVCGDYMPPEHKSSTVRGAYMNDGDSVGVGSGLSALSGFDSESYEVGQKMSYERSPMTGNPVERTTENPVESGQVTSKGWTFDLC